MDKGADYELSVKDNQENLKKSIEDYVQDKELQTCMDTAVKLERNRERIEKRTAFTTEDIGWMIEKAEFTIKTVKMKLSLHEFLFVKATAPTSESSIA